MLSLANEDGTKELETAAFEILYRVVTSGTGASNRAVRCAYHRRPILIDSSGGNAAVALLALRCAGLQDNAGNPFQVLMEIISKCELRAVQGLFVVAGNYNRPTESNFNVTHSNLT